MYTVYVIRSKSGLWYTGYTTDLEKRLNQHNSGISFWTRRDSGWQLVYCEEHSSRSDAMRREKWLKSGAGRDFLRKELNQRSE